MKTKLETRPFNSVLRGSELAVSLGELVPDLLGSKSSKATPFYPTTAYLGSVKTYKVIFEKEDTTPIEVSYTSTVSDTLDDIILGMVASANVTTEVFGSASLDYLDDSDKYFTLSPRDQVKLVGSPTFDGINFGSEVVSAPNGSPSCYMAMQKIPKGEFPRIVVTPLPVISVDEGFEKGVVDVAGEYIPYFRNYLKASYLITAESGNYDKVLSGEVLPAENILSQIKMRLSDDHRFQTFSERVDASFNKEQWDINPAAEVIDTDWMSIASMTITLDIIDEWLDVENKGNIMTAVEFDDTANLRHEGNPDPEIIMDMFIARPDHVTP